MPTNNSRLPKFSFENNGEIKALLNLKKMRERRRKGRKSRRGRKRRGRRSKGRKRIRRK